MSQDNKANSTNSNPNKSPFASTPKMTFSPKSSTTASPSPKTDKPSEVEKKIESQPKVEEKAAPGSRFDRFKRFNKTSTDSTQKVDKKEEDPKTLDKPTNPTPESKPMVETPQEVEEKPKNKNIQSTPKATKRSGFSLFSLFVLLVILILIAGSFLVFFILAYPQHPVSQQIVANSFLSDLVTLPGDREGSGNGTQSSSSSSDEKIINNLIGNNPETAETFQFRQPENAKTTVEVVEDVLPSVLSISLSQGDATNLNTTLSAGTGYIVSEDGLVVSNKHVVSAVCTQGLENVRISAVDHDQNLFELNLLSIDPVDDIAILRIKDLNTELQPVEFGNSNDLILGQDVIAVGNVLGELQNTVTKGIISGLNRSFDTGLQDSCTGSNFQADALIQTDAAINRGNSGGPLFNAAGQLVGMNTLGTPDAQNIGLSIPSTVIQTVLTSFVENNQIVRARLGVISRPVSPILQAENDWLPIDYGEIVINPEGSTAISLGSAAANAGLKDGDIILTINGSELQTTSQNPFPLRRAILEQQPGSEITIKVLKADSGNVNSGFKYSGNEQEVVLKLGSVKFDLSTGQIESSSN